MKNKKLIQLRKDKGLSQEAFARLMGIALMTQYKVENGHIVASRNYMDKLKEIYPDVSIDSLFFNTKQQ